jgi:multiple sugar transport system substrate-binding protein
MPLDEAWTLTAGSGRFPHGRLARRALGRRPYGVPCQTTPELLFYRKDMVRRSRHGGRRNHEPTSSRRQNFHDPARGLRRSLECGARHGARPHIHDDLRRFRPADHRPAAEAGGFAPTRSSMRPTADDRHGSRALAAAEYLMELLQYSPPDILSMSWYERVRPYAAGKSRWPMATHCLRPISSSTASPAHGNTGYLPHPHGPEARRSRRWAGTCWAFHAT